MIQLWRLVLFLVTLCVSCGPVRAQTLLFAGKAVDVERGLLRSDALVVIADDRIERITYDADTTGIGPFIDLSDYTILPGLIDCHTHLTGNWYETDFGPFSTPAPAFGILGVVNAEKTLHAGFTTVRDLYSYYYADVALRDAIAAGLVPGPRVLASGPGLSITGGHGAWGNWLSPQIRMADLPAGVADGETEVRRATREQLKYQVDWIKLFATGGFSSYGTEPGAASYTVEEMRAAVEEAGKRGIPVTAHAHGAQGIVNALQAGVRSIEHGTYLDQVGIDLLKEKGAFLSMDLLAAHYDLLERAGLDSATRSANEVLYRDLAANFANAYRQEVRMVFGTDAGVYPHGRNAEQFRLMVAAGMREADALRSATLTAAELLGIADRVGSLEPGKLADIVAVRGNPLEEIRTLENVVFVMREGTVVKAPTH